MGGEMRGIDNKGGLIPVKVNDDGTFIFGGETVSAPPLYANITVNTVPTALLSGAKINGCTIRNASTISVILCNANGTAGLTLEPGVAKDYVFNGIVQLYAKVNSGTAIMEIEERK